MAPQDTMTLFADKTLVRFTRTAEKRCALLLWAAARDGAVDARLHERAEDARLSRAAFSAWRMRLVELRRARARAEHQAARIFVRSLAHRVEAWCFFTERRRAMAREVQPPPPPPPLVLSGHAAPLTPY